MKKTLISMVAAGLMLTGGTAYAATTTPSVSDLIAQLTAQIANLKAQIAALQTAQANVHTAATDVNSTLQLIGNLKVGMSGDDVKLLQSVLSSDSEVYPEGMVTGYYGKLTEAAVKRFQKKHGIDNTGFTGPKTLAKINEMIKEFGIQKENDDNGNDNASSTGSTGSNDSEGSQGHFCVPPGHLIAPGWLKHHGDQDFDVSECKSLPRGIEWKLDGEKEHGDHGTTTPPTTDTTAPVISAIATVPSQTGVTISWTTNENASSKIYLSTSSPVSTDVTAWTDTNLVTSHSAAISGLSASTVYHFVIKATDASGNTSASAEGTFTTAAVPDTTAPVISSVSVGSTGSTTATVTWTTNENASSRVYYGTTTPLATSTASTLFDATLGLVHSLNLTGLTASTTYYAVVGSADASGNTALSGESSFTTGQ